MSTTESRLFRRQAGSENRKHVRLPGNNKAAFIYSGPDSPPIMCTVADISEGGVGLTVVDTASVPDTFELEIKGKEFRRSCKVAWKKAPHWLGVSFAALIDDADAIIKPVA